MSKLNIIHKSCKNRQWLCDKDSIAQSTTARILKQVGLYQTEVSVKKTI